MIKTSTCSNCGETYITQWNHPQFNQFWHLSNYYGITGIFCSKCYNDVSHDSCGNPNHPKKYQKILDKQKQ